MENEEELIKEINDMNTEINEFKKKVNDIEISIVEINKLARENMKKEIEKSEDQIPATSNIHDMKKTNFDQNLKRKRNIKEGNSENNIMENMTRNLVNSEKWQNQIIIKKDKRSSHNNYG